MKPASEKIVAPSRTELTITSGCGTRTLVKNMAMHSTIAPTITPRSTAPAT